MAFRSPRAEERGSEAEGSTDAHDSFEGYRASITDGWTLWLGPEQNALLENHTQNVCFTVTRQWWQMFRTGAVQLTSKSTTKPASCMHSSSALHGRAGSSSATQCLTLSSASLTTSTTLRPTRRNGVDESELIKRLDCPRGSKQGQSLKLSHSTSCMTQHIRIWCPRTECRTSDGNLPSKTRRTASLR